MLPSPAALQPSVPCPGAGSSRQQEPSTSKDREDETSLQGGAGGGERSPIFHFGGRRLDLTLKDCSGQRLQPI